MKYLDKAKDYLSSSHLKLAVTGLSQSGKTAFITSVVNALTTLDDRDRDHLKFFSPHQKGIIKAIDVIEQTNLGLNAFPYGRHLQSLKQNPPEWPKPTSDMTQTTIAIKYDTNKSTLGKLASLELFSSKTLLIDIFDYPGEWLMDLSMLNKNYLEWSIEMNKLIKGTRCELIKDFALKLTDYDLRDPSNPDVLQSLADSYKDYLRACKKEGLEFIQPGRFVLNGENQDAPGLSFFPLFASNPAEIEKLYNFAQNNPNSYLGVMLSRYNFYQENYVKKFYNDFFKEFDRQVILVDCLTPLNYSAEAFKETRSALEEIFNHFNYGHNSFFSRLLGISKIDKLAFVATKVDHIVSPQYSNYNSLLKDMFANVRRKVKFKEVETLFTYMASIRSTLEYIDKDGHYVLQGRLKDSKDMVSLIPNSSPQYLPDEEFWKGEERYSFDNFLPLPLENQKIRSINLDKVLDFLIADRLD